MLDDVSKQTSIRSDLQADFGRLRRGYEDEPYPEYSDRIARLSKLDALIRDNEAALVDALNTDFGCRSRTESLLAEILCSLDSIKYAKHNLAKWMRKRGRRTSFWALPAKIYARAQPLGVVGIMAPWNYSLDLTLSPLTAALAAGNRVMVCMSPETPTLYQTLSALIESVFTPSEVRIYLGSDELSPAFAALPFDHLLFTGSTRVGRLVAKAAAENLTPITLELGGKSPAIVAPDFNITEAAERISWGKTFNAGQTCVAPDYVMIPKGSEDAFTTALLEKFTTSFHSMDDSDLTAVISERFYKRLTLMVEDAEAKGATILRPAGFEPTAKGGVFKMPLTVVMNPPEDATLMQEEIFGPVLPVLTYQAFSEVAAYVNAKERPLAVYCFSHNRSTIDHLQEQTVSGQFGLNETLIHYAQEDLAFGGVGSSGTGAYHGQAGFDTFSHLKSVLEQRGFFGFTGLKLLHPPYGRVTNLLVSLMKR
jgi:acyl-CoA reductase-like NAD-dependent aldehyde dehydrogenase